MRLLHVGAAAVNQTPLDWDGNLANILKAIEMAKERQVSMLCVPEMAITGYGCEDAFFSSHVQKEAIRSLLEIVPATAGMVVSVGLPLVHAGALFNASALMVDGQLAGFAMKQRLAGDGIHYEPRWFKPWPVDAVAQASINGKKYPIGDLLFDIGGVRVGFEICEDAWVAERPASDHAKLAADVIFNPSASHFAFSKVVIRRRLVAEASRTFGVTYVYSNLLGNEAGRIIYDGHTIIGTHGDLIATGPRLSFDKVTMCDAVVDLDATRMRRLQSASYVPDVIAKNDHVVEMGFELPVAGMCPPTNVIPDWEKSERLQEEEFTRAIALALFDYLRKSRSNGCVVSLSGGADSAAVTCLVGLTIKLGAAELGLEEFARRAGVSDPLPTSEKEMVKRWLTTVYQSTSNSSDTTRNSARTVAEAVGAEHYEIDIENLRKEYTSLIEGAIGRELTWETDDLTLQNIQARVRSPSVWMLANIKNALLLSTSNRSEAAVGYATMDGDTSGGISPIAGIDKAFLRMWLRWLETDGPQGVGPIPEVGVVNRLQPTAELRPLSSKQTDEDDLMPYDLLDVIENHAIGEKRSPQEVLSAITQEFPHYSPDQLKLWVRRFFQLWSRNQWKRERYAVSFHVDDKNLDPKTWCRFPILSGGFRKELGELS